VLNHGLDCQSIRSVMNSVLTSGVINRGLDCQSSGSVMNSVLTSGVINRGLDCQSMGSVMNSVLPTIYHTPCQHVIHYTTDRLAI
jgi:hypothetical protein